MGDVRQPVVGAVAGVVACATMLETAEAAAGVTTAAGAVVAALVVVPAVAGVVVVFSACVLTDL